MYDLPPFPISPVRTTFTYYYNIYICKRIDTICIINSDNNISGIICLNFKIEQRPSLKIFLLSLHKQYVLISYQYQNISLLINYLHTAKMSSNFYEDFLQSSCANMFFDQNNSHLFSSPTEFLDIFPLDPNILSHERPAKSLRDVQKYGKFDHFKTIFSQFLEEQKLPQVPEELKKLIKRKKISQRSLRYIFCSIGILKRFGLLPQFLQFYGKHLSKSVELKYPKQTNQFRTILIQKANQLKESIQILLENNDFDKAINYAFSPLENQSQQNRGRTKNPKQMKVCRDLYYQIFESKSKDISPQGTINKKHKSNY